MLVVRNELRTWCLRHQPLTLTTTSSAPAAALCDFFSCCPLGLQLHTPGGSGSLLISGYNDFLQGSPSESSTATLQPEPCAQAQPGCSPSFGEAERRRLLVELQAYEREALRVENERRTREFVDSMWQGLE